MQKGSPVVVERFYGTDPLGILAIGKTKNLRQRFDKFQSAARNGNAKHSEGRLLYLLMRHGILAKNVIDGLECECVPLKESLTKTKEEISIKCYVLKYGEPPPLNRAIPNCYNAWPRRNPRS